MYPTDNNFWVSYGWNKFVPTLIELTTSSQHLQRTNALSYVHKWNTCIDIGSQFGMWTRPLQTKFKTIHCFEPNKTSRECFLKNISLDNVTLYPYALSASNHSSEWISSQQIQIDVDTGPIQCRTLDSFKIKNVDFIKIDVDSYEAKVLKGAQKTILESTPVINIEMKYEKRREICRKAKQTLLSLGYIFRKRTKSDEVWTKS